MSRRERKRLQSNVIKIEPLTVNLAGKMLSAASIFNIQCFFCQGKKCKHENYEKTVTTAASQVAIHGLNSHWVTPNIIASQRLSSRLIAEFKILYQFKSLGVVAVFNLQEIGEHPSCGDGITNSTGLSYDPEELMKEKSTC